MRFSASHKGWIERYKGRIERYKSRIESGRVLSRVIKVGSDGQEVPHLEINAKMSR